MTAPLLYRPKLWIVAGPNGCGKSTFYTLSDFAEFEGSVWIINPDVLTATLRERENLAPDVANLQAVRRIERWLKQSIGVYQTIGVETVLSTDKYRKLVGMAKRRGFEIQLAYMIVDTVETQLQRIRYRVAKGGHDVPPDKVAQRRGRSIDQLAWFFGQADEAWVYDNSGAEPVLIAHKRAGIARIDPKAIPEIGAALLSARTLAGR